MSALMKDASDSGDIWFHTGTDDISIPAHRLIVSARSPVFSEWLKADTTSSTIEIADFSSKVVRGLVSFMYSGTCDSQLMNAHPEKLFNIAHKYEVRGLVNSCVNYMSANLTAQNALDRLILAVNFHLLVLKANCI
eukprot:gene42931-53264_t